MTAATMFAMRYHCESTRLALVAGGEAKYLVDAVTGIKGSRSIFCENTIFVFRDGSMLRLSGGFALTAGRKGVWRKYRPLD